MTTMVERAKTVHARNIKTAGKQTVTFSRSGESATITDAIGYETVHELTGPDSLPVQVISMIWLLPQSDVKLNGIAVKPKITDEITDSNGDVYVPFRPAPSMKAVVAHCGSEFWMVQSEKRA